MSTDFWDDNQIIHKLLQISGLAPYHLAPAIEESRLSNSLAIYNVCLVILILANVIYSETDPRNGGNYVNKTQVVDTAFDACDWLGNIYVAICVLLSIFQYKNTRSVHFSIQNLDAKFEQMGIITDWKKSRIYLIWKLFVAAILTIIVVGLAIIFEEGNGTSYTILYWICVQTPMVEATIVTIVYGSASLGLYQKLWIINEFLKRIMDDYINRLTQAKPTEIFINYEKTLEAVILKNNFFDKVPIQRAIRRKPLLVFIENYPKCFEKVNINVLKELAFLRGLYNDITETTELMNKLFGPHFLFIFSWYFLGVVINVYSTVTYHVSGDYTSEYGARIVYTVTYVTMISYIISHANVTTGEAKETLAIALKFSTKIDENDDILKREFHHFIMQLQYNPVEFTAAGFFKVNSTLLFAFAVGVITNVIFIVQFDKLNFQTPYD